MPTLNFKQGLQTPQYQSITDMLKQRGSGALTKQDAQNLAYATGNSANWKQYLGQSASNYSIGNLAQFVSPAQNNINPNTGQAFTIPDLGQSKMGEYGFNTNIQGITNTEQALLRLEADRQRINEQRQIDAQANYDKAFAGMENAYNQQSGADLMRGLMAEQGIQDKQNQLVEFQKQLAQLQNDYTMADNAIGNQNINSSIIRGQQFLKQQEFAAKSTLIQSQAAIVEGQLNFAKDLVTSYYDAATTDRNNQINRYQTLLKLADDKLVNLQADEKDNLNAMISTLQTAETRQQDNKDKISALMLDPIASVAWSKTPGLSLDMDYNEIVQKLMPAYAAEQLRQFGIIHPGKSGSGSGLGNTVTGLGIGGKNFTTDVQTIAQNFANMGTNLTDAQYRQAVYALIDTYKFDTTMGEGSDYNMVSSALNNAIASFRQTPTTPLNAPNGNTPSNIPTNRMKTTPMQDFGYSAGKILFNIGSNVTSKPYNFLKYITTKK